MIAVFASTGQSAEAATTITVKVGTGAPGYAVNLFGPEAVYVQPGDTVDFVFDWFEPHSVTFGQPTGDPSVLVGGDNPSYDGSSFISSGLIFADPAAPTTYSVTFPDKGSFEYFCILHPLMVGTVAVQTPDLGTPDNQASVDGRANALFGSALASLKSVAAGMAAKPVAVGANAAGGRKYTLAVSSSTDRPEGDVQQFFPATVNVGVNDSVEWVSGVQTPHTVSIGNPGAIAALIPPGGGEAILDIAAAIPAGGKFDGTGIVNSGVIGVGYPKGTKFELTFSKAGSYDYYCLLHVDQGMAARVVVGAPLPPNTGESALVSNQSGTSGLWIVFGAVGLAFAATGAAFATTRR
jgi:plastocyanin